MHGSSVKYSNKVNAENLEANHCKWFYKSSSFVIGHQHENTRTHKQEVLTGQYTTQPEAMEADKKFKPIAKSLGGFNLTEEDFNK